MTEEQAAELLTSLNALLEGQSSSWSSVANLTNGFVALVAFLAFFWSVYTFLRQSRLDHSRFEMNQKSTERAYDDEMQDKRIESAFRLHNEFFSDAMLKARGVADDYLMTRQGVHFRELHYSSEGSEMNSVFAIMEFYERVSLALRHNQIDRSLAAELFASIYLYWWINYFEKGTKEPNWEVAERLEYLNDQFEIELGKVKYDSFCDRAREEFGNNKRAAMKKAPTD